MRKSGLVAIVILIAVGAYAVGHKSNTNNGQPSNTYGNQNKTNNSPAGSNNNSQPAANTINIRNMMFAPSQITVAKGGTVTWTNNDTTTHTVVDDLSNVGGPNSGPVAPGGTYSFIFTKTGSFQYHCSIHPSMRGTIVVK